MSTTPSSFITGVYSNVLRRSVSGGTATNAELLAWDSLVSSGRLTQVQVANSIATSTEAVTYVAPVVRIYQTFFNRVPDAAGLDYWTGRARAGATFTDISNGFAGAPEFTSVYGAPSSSTIDAILTSLYQNVLGRAADSGGFAFWKARFATLGSGLTAMGSIANSFASSAEFVASSSGTISNLLTTAAFAGSLGTGTLNGGGGGGSALALTLTTSLDVLSGGTGNDVFTADNSGLSIVSSSVDRLSGGLGNDTLKVISDLTVGIESVALPQLNSVETLRFTGGKLAGSTITEDVSGLIGVASLVIDSPLVMANGDLYTLKGSTTQELTLASVNGGASSSLNSTIAIDGFRTIYLDSVGVNAGKITLDISGSATSMTMITTGAISGAGSTAGAGASKITLSNSGSAVTTLGITGDRNLTLTIGQIGLSTISAGLSTGNIAIDASNASTPTSFTFTGGSGNDTMTFNSGSAGQLASGAQLDGGAGTDTLIVNDTTVLTAEQAAVLAGVKNFEVLGFGGTGSGVDVSAVSNFATFKVLAGKLSETFTNALSTSKFTIDVSSATNTVSIANASTVSSISTVTLENNATSSQTMTKLDVGGIFQLALASTTTGTSGGGATVLTEIVNRDGAQITLTGSIDLTITKALQATTAALKFDASAFTGKLSVIGSPLNDTLIGGTGADVIQAAAASTLGQADTLTGGAGADTFKLVATGTGTVGTDFATLMKESTGTSAVLRITDFVAGTDKIHLEIDNTVGASVAGTAVTLATPQTVANAANLVAVWAGITPIAASTPGAGLNAVVVTVSAGALAGTYLYVNDATAGVSSSNDMLINLTGLSGTLTSTDFILA